MGHGIWWALSRGNIVVVVPAVFFQFDIFAYFENLLAIKWFVEGLKN